MAHLTNFPFEVLYKIFTEDASLPLLYHGAKKSKMTKNSNQGGPASTRNKNAACAHPSRKFLMPLRACPGDVVHDQNKPM